MDESKLTKMRRELEVVPTEDRALWIAQRWASAMATHKRLGEDLAGTAARVDEARAALARAEATNEATKRHREEAAEVSAWCYEQIRDLLGRRG